MIKITDLKVRSLDVDFNELSWKIENTGEDVLDYNLQVIRSESMAGPWDVLSEPFSDKYLFYDRFNKPFHNWRALFYSVRVTHKQTGEQKEYGPVQQQAEPDLVTRELRRHINLLLREFAGRRCWILPLRTFGQRCPSCWHDRLQKRTKSGCRTCFDTGFARGYMHPIEVFAQIDSSPPTVDAPNAPGRVTGRVVDIGNIKPRDILIEGENIRWRVVAVNQTELARAPVHQELQLQEIPASDIEYAIPLNLDMALKDMWLTPARNYTNPHNLQSFEDEEIPKVFGLYSSTYPKDPVK